MKPNILTFVGFYLPGFKAGGPIRSISNLIEWLGDDYKFQVVTSDRDLGDRSSYTDVRVGRWQSVGKAEVLYLSPHQQSLTSTHYMLKGNRFDAIYLNSYFSRQTINVLMLRRAGLISPQVPVLLAPRGEFSTGAYEIKHRKKAAYSGLADLLGLYRNVLWHATSQLEAQDITRILHHNRTDYIDKYLARADRIVVAPNLAQRICPPESSSTRMKLPGELRIVYISRITKKKNLEGALHVLSQATGDIVFDIIGPIEDYEYWNRCVHLINNLPPNVHATYLGALPHDKVADALRQYHLYFLPTKGENFGHSIVEALQQGCLVLISDKTPWHQLADSSAGWDLALDDTPAFVAAINEAVAMDRGTFLSWSSAARRYATLACAHATAVAANQSLFELLL